ncbi:MAG: RDD family protein [Anaerolineales bacterium]|nr:RDD family protein [Anaerolineales bacterium]
MSPEPVENYLGYYAGFVSRLAAFAIDVVVIALVSVSVTWFLSVTASMLQMQQILGFSLQQIAGSQVLIDRLFGPLVVGGLALVYVVGYHVFFWWLTGQTPGKYLLGLRVVTVKGQRVPPWRAALRYLGYILAALPLFVGFVWILVDDRRQGWHDKLAGTCVIYTWAARPDERFLAEAIEDLHNS